MNPTNLFSFLFFVFFLAPGLLSEVLGRRREPERKESNLHELSRIMTVSAISSLVSVFFTFLIAILALRAKITEFNLRNLESWQSNGYDQLVTIFLVFSFPFLFVFLWNELQLARRFVPMTNEKIWTILFTNTVPIPIIKADLRVRKWLQKAFRFFRLLPIDSKNGSEEDLVSIPLTVVTLNSGEQVIGYTDYFSSDEIMEERELLLQPVIRKYNMFLPPEYKKLAQKQVSWNRMLIPLVSISHIEVRNLLFPVSQFKMDLQSNLEGSQSYENAEWYFADEQSSDDTKED